MSTDFFPDGRLSFERVNLRARILIDRLNYNKLTTFLGAADDYTLSEKQRHFIMRGLNAFEEIYQGLYAAKLDNEPPSFFAGLWTLFSRRMVVNRQDTMLGTSTAETAGFFRGMISTYFLAQYEVNAHDNTQREIKLKHLSSIINFFGDFTSAKIIFVEFLLRLAIRFQNAVNLLSVNEEGILNFVDFIAAMTFHNLQNKLSVQLNSMNNLGKKIDYLNKLLFNMTKNDLTTSPISQSWNLPRLTLEMETIQKIDSSKEWTIIGLLYKSAMETPASAESATKIANHYQYAKSSAVKTFFYPLQFCTQFERDNAISYESSSNFSM